MSYKQEYSVYAARIQVQTYICHDTNCLIKNPYKNENQIDLIHIMAKLR